VTLLALLVLVWCALAIVDVLAARRDAVAAEAAAREAADLAGAGDLEGAQEVLHDAVGSLDSAQAALHRPWVRSLRLVPYAGTELAAADAGVEAVRHTSLATLSLLDYVLADRAPLYGAGRLEPSGLSELGQVLTEAIGHVSTANDTITAAPHSRLGFVARRLEEADRVTAALTDSLRGAASLVDRLAEAAGGGRPYRLLVLLENGAERRATGGLVGWIALFKVADGSIQLERSDAVAALSARDPSGELVRVEAPADYVRRYGEFLANSTLWLNVNLSPDFPAVAGVAGRLYTAATGLTVDAVARIDLVGLGYLMDAFPEMTIDGRNVAGATLATDFLIDSYRLPSPAEQNAYLAAAVREVFGQLIGGASADRSALLKAVRRAVGERRLAVVTDDDAVNAMLAAAGADGTVLPGGAGDLLVTSQNFAANKVDLFTKTDLTIAAVPDGCGIQGEISLTLTNATPVGMDWLPHLALGNKGRWMVSVYLPRGAKLLGLQVDGRPAEGSFLEEFGRRVVSLIVDAEMGAAVTVTVGWQEQLTEPGYTLTLQPQPLVVPGTLSVNGEPPVLLVETQRREFPDACVG